MRKDFDELIQAIVYSKSFKISTEQRESVKKTHEFLLNFAHDKIIYGINTGFGPMAQYKIEANELNKLQYKLVRSHSSGGGQSLSELQIRALMICRLNTLALGKSGISIGVIDTLEAFIEAGVYPEVFEKGGVGASGDLVQLAHLALGLIGEGYCYYKGERKLTAEVLNQLGIAPLELKLRDGLALINGTSCMSGIALLNIWKAEQLMHWGIQNSSMMNELICSYDDSFSKELNAAKLHIGQEYVAGEMRKFLSDSKLIKKREEHLFKNIEQNGNQFEEKVQEYYSIRCVPQILGPIKDTIDYAKKIVVDEVNSTNDNPITDLESANVFHGGNFHGDYVSFEMDKLKIAITKLTMLAERQLNFLLNHRLNGVFPPFLNKGVLGLNFGLQGMQFVATSTTAENQTLSNPMYVHSISCNNDNQDIVSMGTNSALLADKVIDNAYLVISIQLIAIMQAIDILNQPSRLSSKTTGVFAEVSRLVAGIDNDEPGFEKIQKVDAYLKSASTISKK